MSFRVVRICASCANKVKKGQGYLVLRLLPYIWRGRTARGLFCWHELERIKDPGSRQLAHPAGSPGKGEA